MQRVVVLAVIGAVVTAGCAGAPSPPDPTGSSVRSVAPSSSVARASATTTTASSTTATTTSTSEVPGAGVEVGDAHMVASADEWRAAVEVVNRGSSSVSVEVEFAFLRADGSTIGRKIGTPVPVLPAGSQMTTYQVLSPTASGGEAPAAVTAELAAVGGPTAVPLAAAPVPGRPDSPGVARVVEVHNPTEAPVLLGVVQCGFVDATGQVLAGATGGVGPIGPGDVALADLYWLPDEELARDVADTRCRSYADLDEPGLLTAVDVIDAGFAVAGPEIFGLASDQVQLMVGGLFGQTGACPHEIQANFTVFDVDGRIVETLSSGRFVTVPGWPMPLSATTAIGADSRPDTMSVSVVAIDECIDAPDPVTTTVPIGENAAGRAVVVGEAGPAMSDSDGDWLVGCLFSNAEGDIMGGSVTRYWSVRDGIEWTMGGPVVEAAHELGSTSAACVISPE